MQESQVVQQGNDLLDGVMSYEHPELIERYKRELGLSDAEAQSLFQDTKRYLYLCFVTGKKLAPSAPIDQGWHEFLMYTKDYQDFCAQFFGTFIHHTPKPTLSPHPVIRVSDTNKLAMQHFGDLSDNWRVYAGDCSPDYDCNGGPSCN